VELVEMFKILLLDDNFEELYEMKEYCEKCGAEAVAFQTTGEAKKYIQKNGFPDGMILDILLSPADISGTTFAENCRTRRYSGQIAFLTGSNDYAAESYKVNAVDYCLKPISPAVIWNLIQKMQETNRDTASIPVSAKNETRNIHYSDLIGVEVTAHILKFYTTDGETFRVNAPMKSFSGIILKDRRFGMPHRSFIINFNFVDRIHGKEIVMINGWTIPISKNYSNIKNDFIDYKLGKNISAEDKIDGESYITV
jgi:DNA-binding LytR/AlgR family response regulator